MPPTLEDWGLIPTDWVSPAEAAEYLGVSLDDLKRARRRGVGPTHRRVGHIAVRYSAAGLPNWHGVLPLRKGIPTREAQKVSEVG